VATSWSCTDGNTSQSNQGSAGAPSATAPGSSVSYTVTVSGLSCPTGWHVASASYDISGRATSGGGSAFSSSVRVTYTP
jgi:hypothetical protein